MDPFFRLAAEAPTPWPPFTAPPAPQVSPPPKQPPPPSLAPPYVAPTAPPLTQPLILAPMTFDPTLYQDNGDGTYTEFSTGLIYDANGDPVWAGTVATPLPQPDNTADQSQLLVPYQIPTPNPAAVPAAVDSVIQSIESALTNLTVPLQNAGILKTPANSPAQQNANFAQAAAAQNYALQAGQLQLQARQQKQSSQVTQEIVVGLIVAVGAWFLLGRKS